MLIFSFLGGIEKMDEVGEEELKQRSIWKDMQKVFKCVEV